jgi:hypothetical protein
MLLLFSYQIIAGTLGNIYWDMAATICLSAAISGDSIILLAYDSRWNASVWDMISGEMRNGYQLHSVIEF